MDLLILYRAPDLDPVGIENGAIYTGKTLNALNILSRLGYFVMTVK